MVDALEIGQILWNFVFAALSNFPYLENFMVIFYMILASGAHRDWGWSNERLIAAWERIGIV